MPEYTTRSGKSHPLPEQWSYTSSRLHACCRDYVTILAAVRGDIPVPANKQFVLDNGEPAKRTPTGGISTYHAKTVAVPDLDTFKAILLNLKAHQMLILGVVPGTEDGRAFRIASKATLVRKLNQEDASDEPLGIFIDPQGMRWVGRFKENFDPSSITLLDADMAEDMPESLRWNDATDWLAKMRTLVPPLHGAGALLVPSNSTQLLDVSHEPVFSSQSLHCYTQVDQGALPPKAWASVLPIYAVAKGLDYPKHRYARTGAREGEIVSTLCGSVYDPAPLASPSGIDYAGPPTISEALINREYNLGPPPDIIKVNGGRWNPEALPRPSTDMVRAYNEKYGCRIQWHRERLNGNPRGISGDSLRKSPLPAEIEIAHSVYENLEFDDVLQLADGTQISVREFMESDKPKLRGDAAWRGSTSKNAYINRHKDGTPYIYDNGMRTKFCLSPEAFAREAWRMLADYEYGCFHTYEDHCRERRLVETVRRAMAADVDGAGLTKGMTDAFASLAAYPWGGDDQPSPVAFILAGLDSARIEYEIRTGRVYTLQHMLEHYNRTYGVIRLQGRTKLVWRTWNHDLQCPVSTFGSRESVAEYHAADRAVQFTNGEWNRVEKPFSAWWSWHQRRQYNQIAFLPDVSYNDGVVPALPDGDIYQAWLGYGYRPREDDCSMILNFIHDVIAAGRGERYERFLDTLAAIVQEPAAVGFPIPVLQSGQGAGKNTLIEGIFGPLFGSHMIVVSQPRHIVGNFNAHLAFAALVVVNEGFWGGDRKSEGAYKALFDQTRVLELKGIDAIVAANRSSLITLTNSSWAAPMDIDDRRHEAYEVADNHIGDVKFFTKLRDHINNGGKEAFLHFLLNRKIDKIALRTPPKWASAVKEMNVLKTMDSVTAFAHHLLYTGNPYMPMKVVNGETYYSVPLARKDDEPKGKTPSWDAWWTEHSVLITKDHLYEAYVFFCKHRRYAHPVGYAELFKALQRFKTRTGGMLFATTRPRTTNMDRPRCIELPPLTIAREEFNFNARGLEFSWDHEIDSPNTNHIPVQTPANVVPIREAAFRQ